MVDGEGSNGSLWGHVPTYERRSLAHILKELGDKIGMYGMIGRSLGMLKVYDAISRVANSNATVHITGESGTGKELVARALHNENQQRQDKPFVAVNVTQFDENLLRSELFGVGKKVATGVDSREGLFIQADSGTLFLDEIAEMGPDIQAMLLRVLQERNVVPIGGKYTQPKPFDVRFIAASSRPLEAYVSEGTFRTDLYHRLNKTRVVLPPLHERGEQEISLLARYFCEKYVHEEGKKGVTLSDATYAWLAQQPWPGNVRQLESMIHSAIVWTRKTGTLEPKDFYGYHHPETMLLSHASQPSVAHHGEDKIPEFARTISPTDTWKTIRHKFGVLYSSLSASCFGGTS